jgi:GntR family transcriptional regulator, trigonelline degradation regulator
MIDALKIYPRTVQQQVIERLRSAIVNQHFRPNDRLVETELCKKMGVSRNMLREALRHLEGEKLVTSVPNRGPSVTAIGWDEAQEIYHVRAMLEGEAAALFAQSARPEHLAKMRAALQAFEAADAADDAVGRLESTTGFYDVLLGHCGNRIIRESLQNLTARINFIRLQSMSRAGRGRQSLKEMTAIYSASRAGDAERARAAAVKHVQNACEVAREVFNSLSPRT